jgi:hypothetical protein
MNRKMAILLLGLGMAGCEKSTTEANRQLTGEYAGTFERIQGAGQKESATVTLTFTGDTFTGVSSKPKFPAICNGSYTAVNNEMQFTNACVWTADFDWSLILNNTYSIRKSADSLEIKREYPGQMTDVYRLKKEQK